jgi:hypothetical protein
MFRHLALAVLILCISAQALTDAEKSQLTLLNSILENTSNDPYELFYTNLPVTILTIISIIGAFYIYLLQSRDNSFNNIKENVIEFKKFISKFIDIYTNVAYCVERYNRTATTHRPRSSNIYRSLDIPYEELLTLQEKLIEDYNAYKRDSSNDSLFKEVLRDLERLQSAIYSKSLYMLNGFQYEDKSSALNLNKFEAWLREFIPYLSEIDGIHTAIPFIDQIAQKFEENPNRYISRIGLNNIDNLKIFYKDFFNKFNEIKDTGEHINSEISNYYPNLLYALLHSNSSRHLIYSIISIISLFGLAVPLYMLEPIHFNILPIDFVFYIVLFFLVVVNLALSIAAYYFRYRMHTMVKVSIGGIGSHIRNKLQYNTTVEFRNKSITPTSNILTDIDISIGGKSIKSDKSAFSLGSFKHKFITLDYRNNDELENLGRRIAESWPEAIPSEQLRLLVRCYQARFPYKNEMLLAIGENHEYKWSHLLERISEHNYIIYILLRPVGKHEYIWNLRSEKWEPINAASST